MNSSGIAIKLARFSNRLTCRNSLSCSSRWMSSTNSVAAESPVGDSPASNPSITPQRTPSSGPSKTPIETHENTQQTLRQQIRRVPGAPTPSERANALGRLFSPIVENVRDKYDDDGTDSQACHYFHVYATKHNTHITVCSPKREPLKRLSLSAGNMGFKKSNRGTYDAAYQLANYVIRRIQEQGLLSEIKNIEVVLRGFGVGREAVTKVLLGSEGSIIRDRIKAVSDGTRLKFGGTRSKKPRRLG